MRSRGVDMMCSRARNGEIEREKERGCICHTSLIHKHGRRLTVRQNQIYIPQHIRAVWAIYSPNATQTPQCVKSASQKIASSDHWTIVNTRMLVRVIKENRFIWTVHVNDSLKTFLWFVLKYSVILSVTDKASLCCYVCHNYCLFKLKFGR